MRSLKVPANAATIAAFHPLIEAGVRPGESIVVDDDGVVIIARYPDDATAERIAAALEEVRR